MEEEYYKTSIGRKIISEYSFNRILPGDSILLDFNPGTCWHTVQSVHKLDKYVEIRSLSGNWGYRIFREHILDVKHSRTPTVIPEEFIKDLKEVKSVNLETVLNEVKEIKKTDPEIINEVVNDLNEEEKENNRKRLERFTYKLKRQFHHMKNNLLLLKNSWNHI